jgi:hypothetical protein
MSIWAAGHHSRLEMPSSVKQTDRDVLSVFHTHLSSAVNRFDITSASSFVGNGGMSISTTSAIVYLKTIQTLLDKETPPLWRKHSIQKANPLDQKRPNLNP